jgi:hypothetical protein
MRKFLVLLSAMVFAGIFSASMVQAQHVTKFPASQLVTNGESFFQASNITSELTRLARADGYIGASESFKTVAVSGAPIASIVNQYKSCNPKPIYLVSDGAGIDLMSSSNISGLSNTLRQYLEEMKKGGTKKLLWMIYPDPQGGTWATLKRNQDLWAVAVPPIINGCTDPKTLLIDLRTVWAGHYSQYTSDGIHATSAGGTATAEAFWKMMKDSNFFDLGPVSVKKNSAVKTAPSAFLGQTVSHNSLTFSLNFAQPTTGIAIRIATVSGRTVVAAAKHERFAGHETIKFPLGSIAPGVYCLEVQSGKFTEQSPLLVR